MHLHLFTTLSLALSISACAQNAAPSQKINAENDWSGSASYISRVQSGNSGRTEFTTTQWETFREFKMEASISRGYGSSSNTVFVKEKHKSTESMGGQHSSTETFIDGSAFGKSDTEITVEFTENGKEYSFFIYVPPSTGTETTRMIPGSTTKREIGQDEGMIQVEFQPMGTNPNVIAGEIKDRQVGDKGEITETILRWSFVKGPLDVELLVFPENYKTWLPKPGKSELLPGSQMNIGLKLQGKNGKEPKLKAKSFELKLINTSIEPGVTINYPLMITGEPLPDLRFAGGKTKDGQEISVTSTDGKTGSATLSSYDGAGYTTLQVEAVLEGGIRISGKLEVPDGVTDIDIPKRKKGTKIGDAWLSQYGNPAEDFDEERSKGNDNNGDGLTAYEEYRGVFSEGQFKRLDPRVKELGIKQKKETEAEFQPGLDVFSTASGVTIIKLKEDELGDDRVLNKNRGKNAGIVQHALLLLDERIPGNDVGQNKPIAENGKTPAQSQSTVIDLVKIKKAYTAQRDTLAKQGYRIPYTLIDEISNTVAHELAHGVHVTHHGPNSIGVPRTARNGTKVPFALFASNGDPVVIPAEGIPLDLIGDNTGNESSGDLNCIIAYTTRYQWYYEKVNNTLVYRAVPLLVPGKTLCTSGDPTGINATGFFGKSHKGNCLGQVKIKDQ